MSELCVELRNVTKKYISGPETLTILDDLDLSIRTGESVVITGRSGSGKTTLLNIIGSLDRADSGDVFLSGVNIAEIDETRRSEIRRLRVGFVFQFHYLLKDFTALENVMLPSFMESGKKRHSIQRAEEILEVVGLAGRLHHYPHQLSGGERQRVALARALVNDPPILLADEPTGNLDPAHSKEVQDLIYRTSELLGKTLIVVSHDDELASRATRHLVLDSGALREA